MSSHENIFEAINLEAKGLVDITPDRLISTHLSEKGSARILSEDLNGLLEESCESFARSLMS